MKRNVIIFLIISLLVVSAGGLLGYLMNNQYAKGFSGHFDKDIIISETLVFDEPEIIEQYGHAVVIEAGSHGSISDLITSSGDINGYDYIGTSILLENGDYIKAVISFDGKTEKQVVKATDIYPHSTDKYIIVFDISKIESSQTVLDGYKESREQYYSSVRKARIDGMIIGVSSSVIIMSCIGSVIYFGKKRKESEN
ncbi:hypothetical protein [Butyrivibrio sp. AE2032]|uniref:hypothetical protein n=1 Tax=Butyrivibrio sp. AE2032 TaxID=1458463 RepID=UPI00054D67A2|nr:hypothetical protein [Butyrivibrio sp. AE2032]